MYSLDSIVIVSVGVLAVTLFIVYHWMFKIRDNYLNGGTLVKAITNSLPHQVREELEKNYDKLNASAYLLDHLNRKIDSLAGGVETSLLASKTVAKHLVAVREEVSSLSDSQKETQLMVKLLTEQARGGGGVEPIRSEMGTQTKVLAQLGGLGIVRELQEINQQLRTLDKRLSEIEKKPSRRTRGRR